MPPNTEYVGRPSVWGNPYKTGELSPDNKYPVTAEQAVGFFKFWLRDHHKLKEAIRKELKGKNLACWCKIGQPCHADILLKIANE